MPKPGPKPQPPLWKQPRPLAVAAGGLAAFIALVVGIQQFFSGGSTGGGQTLEQVVENYLEKERKESNAERHQDVERRINKILDLMGAPGYGQLPKAQKEALVNRHRELRDYQEYQKELDGIEDPKNAQTEEQLKKIHEGLSELRIPPEYLTQWSGTAALDRQVERLADAEALQKAVRNTTEGYRALIRDGQQVLKEPDAPKLPQRAQAVLDRARELPGPKTRAADLIPGSRRITNATLFQFAGVAEVHTQWLRIRKTLEGLAGLRKP